MILCYTSLIVYVCIHEHAPVVYYICLCAYACMPNNEYRFFCELYLTY